MVQSMVLVNVVYFMSLCFMTLPLYSLVVHMGSDIKREALPAVLQERLRLARAQYDQASHSHNYLSSSTPYTDAVSAIDVPNEHES